MKISSTAEDAFNRVLSWIERDLSGRMWDWPVALMTIALVQLSSARLSITEWVPSLDITQMISLIAVVLGIFLGYSLFSRMTVIRLAFIYGIFLIPMQLLTGTERTGVYFQDLKNMFFRLLYALDLFIQNQPIDDTLFFILLTSSGFWLVGVYAGYRAMKHRDFLDAALPPGLIILIVQIYDPWLPVRGWGLGIYIFLALALLGRVYFLDNKTSWKRRNVFLPSETEWEFSRSVIFTAAIAVLIAWVLPGTLTRMEAASRSWQDFIHPFTDRFSNAVSALDSPYGTSPGGDFYGSDLKLGSNAPVSDTP